MQRLLMLQNMNGMVLKRRRQEPGAPERIISSNQTAMALNLCTKRLLGLNNKKSFCFKSNSQ